MSEDRFFKQVNATMIDYRPEVPEAVYVGMRKKLWWSNFTRLSATRFNIWYLAVLFLSAGIVFSNLYSENEVAVAPVILREPDAIELPAAETPSQNPVQAVTVSEHSAQKKTDDKHALTNHAGETSEMASIETSSERGTSTQQEVLHIPDVQEASATKETELESTQANRASRKGLKVKTYNSGEKKD